MRAHIIEKCAGLCNCARNRHCRHTQLQMGGNKDWCPWICNCPGQTCRMDKGVRGKLGTVQSCRKAQFAQVQTNVGLKVHSDTDIHLHHNAHQGVGLIDRDGSSDWGSRFSTQVRSTNWVTDLNPGAQPSPAQVPGPIHFSATDFPDGLCHMLKWKETSDVGGRIAAGKWLVREG